MELCATPTTAAITGAYCSLVGLILGPLADAPGLRGNIWLLITVAAVALPAYFFVFGITRAQMVGPWLVQPPLLKRIAAWIISAASVAAAVSLLLTLLPRT
jgi:hypothetical protein